MTEMERIALERRALLQSADISFPEKAWIAATYYGWKWANDWLASHGLRCDMYTREVTC